jgi:hypothetical protein
MFAFLLHIPSQTAAVLLVLSLKYANNMTAWKCNLQFQITYHPYI